MKVYVIYNRATAEERLATDLADRLTREQLDVELLDADSAHGIQLVESYDVLGRPAVMLLKTDGSPIRIWQGREDLPTPSDVSYLAHQ
jgi:hypothetical protein